MLDTFSSAPVILGYTPRSIFIPFHARRQRWACMITHRRAGKTVGCIRDMIDKAVRKPGGRFAYVAPLRNQAKTVAWDYLKDFARPILAKPPNEAELYVEVRTAGSATARITLYGADNPDALRGPFFDGVVLDEYGDMNPTMLGSIIRPALADRKGWCVVVGTIKGRNQLWRQYEQAVHDPTWYVAYLRASQTHLLSEFELAESRKVMSPEQYAAEFECDPYAAIQGAYYGTYLNTAEADGRITDIPHERGLPVHTAWDLGVGDSTAIWFWQAIGDEIRIIDFYENHGKGLPHYVGELSAKGYQYGKDFVPHDIIVKEFGTGKTRVETMAALGRRPFLVPNHKIMDGINGVRQLLPCCWFDEARCRDGLEALRQYQTEWSDKDRCFRDTPKHDWTSHAADAFRYLAMAAKQLGWSAPPPPRKSLNLPDPRRLQVIIPPPWDEHGDHIPADVREEYAWEIVTRRGRGWGRA
jgi:phage terminase large subunit